MGLWNRVFGGDPEATTARLRELQKHLDEKRLTVQRLLDERVLIRRELTHTDEETRELRRHLERAYDMIGRLRLAGAQTTQEIDGKVADEEAYITTDEVDAEIARRNARG